MRYWQDTWRESRMHVLEFSAREHRLAAVPVKQAFPLDSYGQPRPPQLAEAAGAVASVGGSFGISRAHGYEFTRQPKQLLMIDREIWTTGTGRGGTMFANSSESFYVGPPKLEIHLWGSGIHRIVEAVNAPPMKRSGNAVEAFTYRGGKNVFPTSGHYHTLLREAGPWELVDGKWQRPYTVEWLGRDDRISSVQLGEVCLQSKWTLGYELGDEVRWVQKLAWPGTRDVVAGPTELVQAGTNHVPFLDLQAVASNGPDNWYIRKNPRTGLGASVDGKTGYIVVAEGRVPGSRGLRLKEFAKFFVDRLQAYGAVNIDGGGSSHMWLAESGLVADSCYGNGTVAGIRPNTYATAVFEK